MLFYQKCLIFVFYLGSGGNNHAVEYYKETSYPLAVKLGTITPDGAGTPLNDYSFAILISKFTIPK